MPNVKRITLCNVPNPFVFFSAESVIYTSVPQDEEFYTNTETTLNIERPFLPFIHIITYANMKMHK